MRYANEHWSPAQLFTNIKDAMKGARRRRFTSASSKGQPRAWLPAVSPDAAGQLALFQKNCVRLKTDCRLARGVEEAAKILSELSDQNHWSVVATHRHVLLDPIVPLLGVDLLHVEQCREIATLEKASVGITACDPLIAQTGSILLTARSAGGRALSVLPPHHVVIAQASQLVPSFFSDVQPVSEEWRQRRKLPLDPLAAFRESGYESEVAKERKARRAKLGLTGSGSYAQREGFSVSFARETAAKLKNGVGDGTTSCTTSPTRGRS